MMTMKTIRSARDSWKYGFLSPLVATAAVMLCSDGIAAAERHGLEYALVASREATAAGATTTLEMIVLNRGDSAGGLSLPSTIAGTISQESRRWPVAVAVERDATDAIPPGDFALVRLKFDVPARVIGDRRTR